jgi:hypothetical protein
MADLPDISGRSPSGGVVETPSAVPAWLAARRARVREEIEFAESDEAPVTDEDAADSSPQLSADTTVKSQPDPEVPPPEQARPEPPPLPVFRLEPPRVTRIAEPPSPESADHNSLKNRLLRILRSAAMVGLMTSLVLHTVGLLALGLIYMGAVRINPGLDVLGVLADGSDAGDLDGLDLDSAMPLGDPGPANSFEFADVTQMTGDLPSFDASSTIRGSLGSAGKGTGTGGGGDGGEGMSVGALKVPSYAVTKGSFSVWTDPKDPIPGVSYNIVIQFRLPSNVKTYRGSDLTGMVIGTDDYRQVIKLNETVPVTDGKVQFRILVPGAHKLVRDTLRVQSKLLREKQVIEIEF